MGHLCEANPKLSRVQEKTLISYKTNHESKLFYSVNFTVLISAAYINYILLFDTQTIDDELSPSLSTPRQAGRSA